MGEWFVFFSVSLVLRVGSFFVVVEKVVVRPCGANKEYWMDFVVVLIDVLVRIGRRVRWIPLWLLLVVGLV